MLVDLSMAGDSEVLGDVKLKVTGGGSLYDGVLKQLQRLAQYILSNGVSWTVKDSTLLSTVTLNF